MALNDVRFGTPVVDGHPLPKPNREYNENLSPRIPRSLAIEHETGIEEGLTHTGIIVVNTFPYVTLQDLMVPAKAANSGVRYQ